MKHTLHIFQESTGNRADFVINKDDIPMIFPFEIGSIDTGDIKIWTTVSPNNNDPRSIANESKYSQP